MMHKVTLFHDASKGGQKQWSIWVEADGVTVTVEWGLVGMKLQRSSDTPKSKGKAGSKSFKDIAEVAQDNYTRQIKKKREEGYREAGEANIQYDPLTGLDKNFVPAKPINDMSVDELNILDHHGLISIQRKRDGQRHLMLFDYNGTVRLYSRRLESMTANFPMLCASAKGLFPPGSIIDGEIIISRNGVDQFKEVSSITKAMPKKAAEYEAKNFGVLNFMIFDVLYYSSRPAWMAPYKTRYALAQEHLTTFEANTIYLAPILNAPGVADVSKRFTFANLQEVVKRDGWEGLVCWRHDDSTIVKLGGGSPKRTNCAKWKPVQERDFIATGYFLGSGNMSDVAGGLELAEIDPKWSTHRPDDGGSAYRSCGNCGTGFNDAMRKEILSWEFPCVVKIRFDKQEPTAKLRFAVFLDKHEDKFPEECIGLDLAEVE